MFFGLRLHRFLFSGLLSCVLLSRNSSNKTAKRTSASRSSAKVGKQLRVTRRDNDVSDWAVVLGVTLRDWLRANQGLLTGKPARGSAQVAGLSPILGNIFRDCVVGFGDCTSFRGVIRWCHNLHTLRGQEVAVGLHFLMSVAGSQAFDS